MGDKIIELLISNSASCIVGMMFAYLNYQIGQMQTDRKKKAEIETKARELQRKVDLWSIKTQLYQKTNDCISCGFISVKELAELEEGFSLYEDMGGNGEIKIRMGIVRELPHKD